MSRARPPPAAGAADRLLAWKAVKDITGLSRTTAWRLQRAGSFPAPVVISPGRVGWRESELLAWQASRAPRAPPAPRSFAPDGEGPAPPCGGEDATPAAPERTPRPRPRARRAAGPEPASRQMRFDF